MALVTFKRLRSLHADACKQIKQPYDRGIGCLGLILDKKLDQSRYDWCTPSNCRTFATTGGNGVHFSYLKTKSRSPGNSPIVMTNPGGGSGLSYIVGENLWDFLCLGYHRGYFALEQLDYQLELTLEVFTNSRWRSTDKRHDDWVGYLLKPKQRAVLKFAIKRLQLRPWSGPQRFHELQDRYLPALETIDPHFS